MAPPCAGLWGELGMETVLWSDAQHTLPPFPMESALSQPGAQHLCGNHRPSHRAGCRGHPWEVQCPERPGLLLTPVMDSPEVSLVSPHSLPGHCPGALNSIYLSGCHKGHITDQVGTTCVAFCLLRKLRETKTGPKIKRFWKSPM